MAAKASPGSEGNLADMMSKAPRYARNSAAAYKGATSSSTAKRRLMGCRNSGLERRSSNSWHNLIQPKDSKKTSSRQPCSTTGVKNSDLLAYLEKQEAYIRQLEQEAEFHREETDDLVGHLRSAKLASGGAENTNNILANLMNDSRLVQLEGENSALRQKLQAATEASEQGRELVESFRKENEMLAGALQRMRAETEEAARREAEAADQVQRSVEAAEQLRMERSELEFDVNQLRAQIDRQQGRIRTLMEEQDSVVEREKRNLEAQKAREAQSVHEELGDRKRDVARLEDEVAHQQRIVAELTRVAQEKDRVVDRIREDTEKRIGEFHLENVNIAKARQGLELEMARLRMEAENRAQSLMADKLKVQEELKGVRSLMASTQDMLKSSREEILALLENNAVLERELTFLKLRGPSVRPAGHQQVFDSSRPFHHLGPLSKDLLPKAHSSGDKVPSISLEELTQRQSQIIEELKTQCLMATDKLQALARKHRKERAQFEYSLAVLLRNKAASIAPPPGGLHYQQQRLDTDILENLCQKLEEVLEKGHRGGGAASVGQRLTEVDHLSKELKAMKKMVKRYVSSINQDDPEDPADKISRTRDP